jgi:hypothetical protein
MEFCGLERGCVDQVIRQAIICEAHESAYSIHPGSTKMYLDLKVLVGWIETRCSRVCGSM